MKTMLSGHRGKERKENILGYGPDTGDPRPLPSQNPGKGEMETGRRGYLFFLQIRTKSLHS